MRRRDDLRKERGRKQKFGRTIFVGGRKEGEREKEASSFTSIYIRRGSNQGMLSPLVAQKKAGGEKRGRFMSLPEICYLFESKGRRNGMLEPFYRHRGGGGFRREKGS